MCPAALVSPSFFHRESTPYERESHCADNHHCAAEVKLGGKGSTAKKEPACNSSSSSTWYTSFHTRCHGVYSSTLPQRLCGLEYKCSVRTINNMRTYTTTDRGNHAGSEPSAATPARLATFGFGRKDRLQGRVVQDSEAGGHCILCP